MLHLPAQITLCSPFYEVSYAASSTVHTAIFRLPSFGNLNRCPPFHTKYVGAILAQVEDYLVNTKFP